MNHIDPLFDDRATIARIRRKLPYLFQLAELENQRAGKVGMEVGSLRERILIALLIYRFGEDNVETELPITLAEADVLLFDRPISIKTITNNRLSGIKLIWTVDWDKVNEFIKNYTPNYDILLAQIKWEKSGYLFYIPKEVHQQVFHRIGRDEYFKVPKQGTNPRGVEIARDAMEEAAFDELSIQLKLDWKKSDIDYNPYNKWVNHWVNDE